MIELVNVLDFIVNQQLQTLVGITVETSLCTVHLHLNLFDEHLHHGSQW